MSTFRSPECDSAAVDLHGEHPACVAVDRMGCGALDYRQQAQQMELRTGGMSVSTQVIPDSTQLDMFEQVRCVCVCERRPTGGRLFIYLRVVTLRASSCPPPPWRGTSPTCSSCGATFSTGASSDISRRPPQSSPSHA